ncbi:MAG TPA: hypothetical protein VFV73_37275 [Streptosporangiaceae bacterium]|nr:hypothetical protein [Streptosporangiaceae bacterium]
MTASVSVKPSQQAPAPIARGAWWRSRLDRATTPTRLGLLLAVLIVLSLAWGVLAGLTASQHASAAADVVAVSEPLSLDAEQIYTSLSDAGATAASAFLAGGLEPAKARQRYQADITQAAIKIEAASALVGSSAARTQLPGQLAKRTAAADAAIGDDLAILSGQLPAYADEVGTARADNRLGLPLGAAYLREASELLRTKLLPAAGDIYTRESALLTSSSAQATGLPLVVVAVLVGLGIGYVLVRSSRWLARHTHRMVNYGLLLTALAGLVSLVWLAGAFALGRADLLHAQQQGSVPAQAFARAEVAALQAHADESLTLIDNSGEDSYQQDFEAQVKALGPGPGSLLTATGSSEAVAQAQAWYQAHKALRAQDDAGNHATAVASAQTGAAAQAFGKLSATLSEGITTHQATFDSSARSGRNAFTGLAIGMVVAALVMVAGCAWGLTRRLAEYR